MVSTGRQSNITIGCGCLAAVVYILAWLCVIAAGTWVILTVAKAVLQ